MSQDCRCGHPREDHVTGLCLSTLDCLCRGFAPCGEEEKKEMRESDHAHDGENYLGSLGAQEYLQS
jgi:hypothetical protein